MKKIFPEKIYKDLKGVSIIDGKKSGKNIGIIFDLHQNYCIGMKIFKYFLKVYELKSKLKSGKIYLIFTCDNFVESSILKEVDIILDINITQNGSGIIGKTHKDNIDLAKSFMYTDSLYLNHKEFMKEPYFLINFQNIEEEDIFYYIVLNILNFLTHFGCICNYNIVNFQRNVFNSISTQKIYNKPQSGKYQFS